MVFVEEGPLYLVAVSATGEPVSVLRQQLQLLHAQILCILTDGFHRIISRNARYDSRRLLGQRLPVLTKLTCCSVRYTLCDCFLMFVDFFHMSVGFSIIFVETSSEA